MQIHRNIIAFVVLRCFDRFEFKSMQIHGNLITFVVLRCFDRFDIKSMQFMVFCSLLEFCVVLIVLRRKSTFLIVQTSYRCKFILI